jgi:hypothetical protein
MVPLVVKPGVRKAVKHAAYRLSDEQQASANNPCVVVGKRRTSRSTFRLLIRRTQATLVGRLRWLPEASVALRVSLTEPSELRGTDADPQIRLSYRRSDMWMPIKVVELRGDHGDDPDTYVISTNIRRRHLNHPKQSAASLAMQRATRPSHWIRSQLHNGARCGTRCRPRRFWSDG